MCVGRKKIYYKFLSVLVLLLGIAIPFFLMRYSINFSDEPYQILNAMDYHQNPATIFSTYIYHLLGEICGYRLLTMRAFMAIFSIITVFVPTLYFYFNRRNVWEAMIVGGLALLLLSIIQQKSTLVGWDILSNLTLTISTLILLLYIEVNKKTYMVLLMSIFVALAILSRAPNVVLIPIALAVILFGDDNRYRIKRNAVLFLVSISLSMLLIVISIYGDINSYIYAWQEWGFTGGHEFLHLMNNYINDSLLLVCVMGLVALVYLSFVAIKRYATRSNSMKLNLIVVLFWLLFFMLLFYKYEQINILTNRLYTAIYLWIIIYVWDKCRGKMNLQIKNKVLLIILLCSIIPSAGSDTGWFKIANVTSVVFLLPMFVATVSKISKTTVMLLLVSILMYSPCSKARELYFDEGLVQATARLNLSYLTGIYTAPANKEILMGVNEKEKHSLSKDVLFVGFGRQLFEYMLNCRAHYAIHDFRGTLGNEEYILSTKTYLEKTPTIKRVYLVDWICLDYTNMDEMLEEKGYVLTTEKSCYKIYEKVSPLE